jgi:hypothetical protein
MKMRALPYSLVAVVLLHTVGCTLYLNQPVTFRVRDAETKQPIEGAEIRTTYLTMLDFGVLAADWGPKEGVTDADGKVTLFIDPKKDCLEVDASAVGYHPEPHMSRTAIRKRLVSRRGLVWGSDFVLDMYKDPMGRLDLVLPNGYLGPVLIRFAPVDSPPERTGQRHFAYEVGLDGQVAIRESGLFERVSAFGCVHARFRDGIEVPTAEDRSGAPIPPNSVALRFITPVWEHHTWVYVIGMKADADAMNEALWGDGNHFNELAFTRLNGSP